jgi:hypothetical protein
MKRENEPEREVGRGKQVVAQHAGPGQLEGPLTPASIRALQRAAGNAAVSRVTQQLLQRRPNASKRPPAAPAKPVVDDYAAGRDYAEALQYVDNFYERVRDALALHDKVREDAQKNYETFGALKDPPSLADEVVKSLFSSVLSAVPGWGGVLAKGLEIGLFAAELGKLKRELDEHPIPGYSVADEETLGPSASTKARAEKHAEHVKTGWDAGTKVVETVIDVLAKQQAAAAAEKAAIESAGLSRQRITDWAKGVSVAQNEEEVVTAWLKQAGADNKQRGGMLALVQKRLGPLIVVDAKQVDALTKRYELELYRKKFGGPDGAGKYVRTIYTGLWDDSDPTSPELRVTGELSQATRRRIAWCAGVTATDDATMVKVLGISTVTERVRNPGLKRTGEM